MKKNKKLNLPKNKILSLLSVILILFISLLTVNILIQTRYSEPTIEDIETETQNEEIKKHSKENNTSELKIPKVKKYFRILRSENGKIEITNSTRQEQTNQDESKDASAKQQNPSMDAITAEITGVLQSVPLTAIPAPLTQNEEQVASIIAPKEQTLYSETNTQNALLDAESGSVIAKAQTEETQSKDNQSRTTTTSPYKSNGTLIFVFDDAGHNMEQLQPFLELPFPITIAVLPGLDYSIQVAQKVRNCGKELILHQPMRAKNKAIDPGPCAIEPDMTPEEVYELVRRNLAEVGPVSGINNHEGSLITEDENLLGAVMDVCRAEKLYFLDSRTTPASIAKKAATQRDLPIWERTVFLDNTQNRKDIEIAVRLGMELASKNGSAIMIGHIWTSSLPAILIDLYPEMIMQGYSVSTISKSRSKITGN